MFFTGCTDAEPSYDFEEPFPPSDVHKSLAGEHYSLTPDLSGLATIEIPNDIYEYLDDECCGLTLDLSRINDAVSLHYIAVTPNEITFDFEAYQESIFSANISYDFRIIPELYSNIRNIVMLHLSFDQIIPDFLTPIDFWDVSIANVHILDEFIQNHVTVDVVDFNYPGNTLERTILCCNETKRELHTKQTICVEGIANLVELCCHPDIHMSLDICSYCGAFWGVVFQPVPCLRR